MTRYRDEMRAGAIAFSMGEPATTNPHVEWHWQSQAWRAGYEADAYERRRLIASGMPADGFTPTALQEIANGGIMDACAIYLPAGRVSVAEAKAREDVRVIAQEQGRAG